VSAIPEHTGVIIVDHGSKRAAANDMLNEVVARFREATGAPIVEAAHMELAEPTIADAFQKCVGRGARRIVIHPYFLSPGRHSTSDIPRLCAAAAAHHPGVDYAVTEPLGLDPRMNDIILRRIEEALAQSGADIAP